MSDDNGQPKTLGRKLSDFSSITEDDPNELLKYGFLCREGVLGIYGKTGIGKSSLAVQFMILWALGRECFGIVPKRPLKSVLIQAENDDRDIVETRDGIIAGLKLTPEETKQACDNIIVVQEDSRTGYDFFTKTVSPALKEHKPDLLGIDPALSYLGGDAISQEVVGDFLRNKLKPLLREHGCAAVVLHHMNKTGSGDNAYAGSGSAEWANMPRAILTLTPAGKNKYELSAVKRGSRLRWKMPDGKTRTLSRLLKHSDSDEQIFWSEADADDYKSSDSLVNPNQVEDEIFSRVPETTCIERKKLVEKVNAETKTDSKLGIGINKIDRTISEMISEGKLFAFETPRSYARAQVFISRQPKSELSKIVNSDS